VSEGTVSEVVNLHYSFDAFFMPRSTGTEIRDSRIPATPAVAPKAAGDMTFGEVELDALPQALDGRPRAVERVLAVVRPFVVRYCRARQGRAGGSFAAADALAQDVCLTVLSALPRFPDAARTFLAFVYGIAVDKANGVAEREQSTRLNRLLGTLPESQREVILLRMVVRLSLEETAEATGMSPSGVRLAQHRALSTVRGAL
jgi:RNA polymerase sigma-70 factor (ECF subfamily)